MRDKLDTTLYTAFKELYQKKNIRFGEPLTVIFKKSGLKIFYDEEQINL